MIAIDRRGEMGNNLFQWAFGIAAGKRLSTRFTMDDTPLSCLFTLDGPTGSASGLRRLAWRARQRIHEQPIVEIDPEDDPTTVMAGLRDGARYGGFFQSAEYFASQSDVVRRAFTVRPEHGERFLRDYEDLIRDGYVCVHVRRGDYLDWGADLPWSYFRRCLELAGDVGQVVFTSDDMAAVRAEFATHPAVRFETNEPIIDLQLMMHARACVLSSSSFSWWGAWLNRRPERRVYAPQHWLGFRRGQESPRRVIPDDWTQIPVPADQAA